MAIINLIGIIVPVKQGVIKNIKEVVSVMANLK